MNFETLRYQFNIATLWELGIIDFLKEIIAKRGSATIIEIGGGYGAMAYFIRKILPQVKYIIVDLPETLLFSSIYLSINLPEDSPVIFDGKGFQKLRPENKEVEESKIILVPNNLSDEYFMKYPNADLVLNYASFGEMTSKQVELYAKLSASVLGDAGILVESNQREQKHTHSKVHEELAKCFRHSVMVESTFFQFDGRTTIWTKGETHLEGQQIPYSSSDCKIVREMFAPEFPIIVVHGYKGFNILHLRESFYGVRQSIGFFDPDNTTSIEMEKLVNDGDVIISIRCEHVEIAIDRLIVDEPIIDTNLQAVNKDNGE